MRDKISIDNELGMTKFILFILIVALSGCADNGNNGNINNQYDPDDQIAEMRYLVNQYRPDILEENSYQKIIMFRDHIHHITEIYPQPLSLPFWAYYYQETFLGTRSNLCQGMSIHLAAFLQVYGYTWRHIELWTNEYTPDGTPITHSVLEIWVEDHWELHDTTYNCVFRVSDGPPLSAQQIKDVFDIGIEIQPDLQGFDGREGYDIFNITKHEDDSYYEYFNEIKYTFSAVFY